MIESKDNEKLKLVRKLRERKHREREGLFATEGEDLLKAGLAAGAKPRFVLIAAGARSSLGPDDEARSIFGPVDGPRDDRAGGEEPFDFDEIAPELLASVSSLGSGTRAIAVWTRPAASAPVAPCVYLDAVGDPANVGAIVRTAHALLDATVVLGPGCADAYGPKATRASMGSLFARPPATVTGVEATPEPRVALVAHGGEGLGALAGASTLCLGAEREGLRPEVAAACAASATIPMRGGAESLNVAAAAAVACARMSEAWTDA